MRRNDINWGRPCRDMTLPKFSVLAVPCRIFERSTDVAQPQVMNHLRVSDAKIAARTRLWKSNALRKTLDRRTLGIVT